MCKILRVDCISKVIYCFCVFNNLESNSSTFNERNCANFLAPVKNLTFTSSTKKLPTKLSYEKAARKMLMKLTPNRLLLPPVNEVHHHWIKKSNIFPQRKWNLKCTLVWRKSFYWKQALKQSDSTFLSKLMLLLK